MVYFEYSLVGWKAFSPTCQRLGISLAGRLIPVEQLSVSIVAAVQVKTSRRKA